MENVFEKIYMSLRLIINRIIDLGVSYIKIWDWLGPIYIEIYALFRYI